MPTTANTLAHHWNESQKILPSRSIEDSSRMYPIVYRDCPNMVSTYRRVRGVARRAQAIAPAAATTSSTRMYGSSPNHFAALEPISQLRGGSIGHRRAGVENTRPSTTPTAIPNNGEENRTFVCHNHAPRTTFTMMTSAETLPAGADHLRSILSKRTFLHRLAALVRRAVPADAVDDITQSVVCDALSATALPERPEDMDRWIRGIARHKIADYHRAASRRPQTVEAAEAWALPPPFEARSGLSWVARQVEGRPVDLECLGWLVEASHGEPLDRISERAGQSHANVRQRVCRLRASLKRRWLLELAAAALVAVVVVSAVAGLQSSPDKQDIAWESAASLPPELQGVWQVVEVHPSADLDPVRAAILRSAGRTIEVRVEGNRLVVSGPGAAGVRSVAGVATGPNTYSLVFLDGAGNTQQAEATRTADGTLNMVSTSGVWKGTVVLAR